MPKTLYLIDGHAQIYRAYYAPFGNLTSPRGEPTRAVHVFCQMILNLLRDKKPDYLVTVLDVSDETVFRKEIYPEYKAHRDPAPEDMEPQFNRILSILNAARLPILRMHGFEADDIMATLARRLSSDDLHVYLVSKDKDLEQLLGPHVSLYDPGKDEVITPDVLFATKGWWPQQAVEAQTLIGDTVDNVPGVPGIGPKTAAKLIQQYGSAQGVIDNADKLTPKQRDNVKAFAALAPVTRKLVTLRDDVPIELDLSAAQPDQFTWSAVRPIFEELGIRRLTDQLPANRAADAADRVARPPSADSVARPPSADSVARPPSADSVARPPSADSVARPPSAGDAERRVGRAHHSPAALAGQVASGAADAAEEVGTAHPTKQDPAAFAQRSAALSAPDGGEYVLVNTPAALDAFVADLAKRPEFVLDTETTGVNPVDAELVGLSFSWRPSWGVYIPVRCIFGGALPLDEVRARLAPILADDTKRKIGHNIKYDLIVLENAGMTVRGPILDTMITAFLVEPTRNSYGLDPLARTYLAHEMIPLTDLIGAGRDQLVMDQVPLERVAEYAAEDADYTWRLKELFEPSVEPLGLGTLAHEVEMPLVRVLANMEHHGIRVDLDYLRDMGRRMSARIEQIVVECHQLAGGPFNLDSPKQLGEVLFDRMQLRVVKRTKTARSTDAETLEILAEETGHPLLKLLLEHREIQKLRGTYVDALPRAVSRRTGRIHTSFHQTGAVTGRLSSSEPNLQNIPVRTEMGRQIRRAFRARGDDELLIVADYSQVELRILAHFCQDEALKRAFADDLDIHAFVASQVNNVALDAVTKEMRAKAKAVNFGIIYGQTAHGLAQTTGMSRTEAQKFIDAYFARYSRIRGFINQCIETARRDGAVRTILGRRRPITDIDSRNRAARALAERLSVNTVIQGSAADLIKTAMIQLHNRVRDEKLPLRMLLQVHDELVCEAPRGEAEALGRIVADVMSTALPLSVPLRVDVECAENWLDAK
ncbi:DNA polymerase I [Phycisphaerae bacterium RAS1]|nr:DNA polymerase I [Phycisphaerae bacterium RAS1]